MSQGPRAWKAHLSSESVVLLERLDIAVDALCGSYFSDLESGKIVPERKIIQDSLWGFIDFGEAEVAFIDSPLLQRLRFIRQLGFAYLLFPNAGYSRFEHSLGVCHVIKEFARILNDERPGGRDNQKVVIRAPDLAVLSLAALLHDVGHIAFSHVSERGLLHFGNYRAFFDDLRSAIKRTISMRPRCSQCATPP